MATKLIVSELAARGRYVTREAYLVMSELVGRFGWVHVETHRLAARPHALRELIREHCGATPDVVLFWETYDLVASAVSEVYHANFRVVLFCEDLHWFNGAMESRKTQSFTLADLILASYAPVFDRFFPAVAAWKRVVWVPHAASPEFLLPLNEHAENVVLLSGMINDYYPLRQRLKSLADRSGLAILEQPHPGYGCHHDHETSEVVGAGYARRINAARAAFTDASRFQYVLAKFFEIPAAGSLLLGDVAVEKELAQLGFLPRVHYIPISGATLESEIRDVLDATNHAELDQIRRRGQQLVGERHTTGDRARLIDEVCTAGQAGKA